jgi:hypothetical protein
VRSRTGDRSFFASAETSKGGGAVGGLGVLHAGLIVAGVAPSGSIGAAHIPSVREGREEDDGLGFFFLFFSVRQLTRN